MYVPANLFLYTQKTLLAQPHCLTEGIRWRFHAWPRRGTKIKMPFSLRSHPYHYAVLSLKKEWGPFWMRNRPIKGEGERVILNVAVVNFHVKTKGGVEKTMPGLTPYISAGSERGRSNSARNNHSRWTTQRGNKQSRPLIPAPRSLEEHNDEDASGVFIFLHL